MSDYISREAANEACREAVRRYPNSFYNGIEAARDAIRKLPAADVRPRWVPVTERLPKKMQYVLVRYKNNDMADLEAKLQEADANGARIKLIATDGVFSMDGIICNLRGICDLADKYEALVMVDDSHAVGFVGAHGKGTQEYCDVMGRVDIITGTLGKALGGASGGYTSGRKEIIDLLRQRSRPYLFSNSLAPAIAGASIEMFNMLEESTALRDHLEEVTLYYRKRLVEEGFDIIDGVHPCVPVMFYDEKLTAEFAKRMVEKGVYVVAFSYQVVPKGKARIRTQVCANHTKEDIDFIVKCFKEVRDEMK